MSPQFSLLRFAWWNLCNFAHFDPNRVGEARWPSSQAEYDAKCARVDAALRDLIARHPSDILGFCEITERAAEGLRQRLFPGYLPIYPNPGPNQFQVVVLFRQAAHLQGRAAIEVPLVPRTTRLMPVLDHKRSGHQIKFIFCHWTAYGEHDELYRQRAADAVATNAYRYLHEPGTAKSTRHVVILGDLNEEPFGAVFQSQLSASRDRLRSVQPLHYSDRDTRRVRFYNQMWRLLGERHPHGQSAPFHHCAGTYFNESGRSWHTYDQILVSGSLLDLVPPFLDEGALEIMVLPGCFDGAGRLLPFRWNDGHPTGLSDHLPLVGQICLPGS